MTARKAQATEDLFMLLVILLILAIACVLGTYVFNKFVDLAETTQPMNESATAMEAIHKVQDLQSKWDYFILVIFIGFAMALIILGYFIDVHSVFMALYVISLIIGAGLAYIFQYLWDNFSGVSEFVTTVTTYYPITNHIFGNLAVYFTIIGLLAMIATFAKPQNDGVGMR